MCSGVKTTTAFSSGLSFARHTHDRYLSLQLFYQKSYPGQKLNNNYLVAFLMVHLESNFLIFLDVYTVYKGDGDGMMFVEFWVTLATGKKNTVDKLAEIKSSRTQI